MSLLSGLFTEREKAPAPRFVVIENVARMPECEKRPTVAETPHTSTLSPEQLAQFEEDPDQPQHYIQTAVTASPEWRQARDQYINHLMTCRGCYAPASRYCMTGAELRTTYDSTPMEVRP
ncbi:MAG: hypothetical protein V7764_04745 [Pseudomonas marincola]|jgi:hypothetical protein|uniref:hypothetical protein n=1 Tax=Pseudomonas marincola TaxID=437900 RepID=UPI0030029B33